MTQQEIEDGTRVIAQFLEQKILSEDEPDFGEGEYISEFEYHSSLDWLMPAIYKIRSVGYPVTLYFSNIESGIAIHNSNDRIIIREMSELNPPVETIFKGIVKFLKIG